MKPRGRPEQLLQKAEIELFIEFVEANQEASSLQKEAVSFLREHDYTFEQLSESQRLIVKEAYKPFREHLKIKSLAEHFKALKQRSVFEDKFLELYEENCTTQLKAMATRYARFKKHQEDEQALMLFLNQLDKKEQAKKRKAEDRRKYELGGAVLAAYKKLNINITKRTAEEVTKNLLNSIELRRSLRNSPLGKELREIPEIKEFFNPMLIQVVKGFSTWSKGEEKLTTIEIKKALLLLEEYKAKQK